jgi:hypothetical protein
MSLSLQLKMNEYTDFISKRNWMLTIQCAANAGVRRKVSRTVRRLLADYLLKMSLPFLCRVCQLGRDPLTKAGTSRPGVEAIIGARAHEASVNTVKNIPCSGILRYIRYEGRCARVRGRKENAKEGLHLVQFQLEIGKIALGRTTV